jgi:hypothetical protein
MRQLPRCEGSLTESARVGSRRLSFPLLIILTRPFLNCRFGRLPRASLAAESLDPAVFAPSLSSDASYLRDRPDTPAFVLE